MLFGYANPIEAIGTERFADEAKRAGADGVLIVDYPPEEAAAMVELLDARELDTIFLLSPTTTDARLKQVAALGRAVIDARRLAAVQSRQIDRQPLGRAVRQGPSGARSRLIGSESTLRPEEHDAPRRPSPIRERSRPRPDSRRVTDRPPRPSARRLTMIGPVLDGVAVVLGANLLLCLVRVLRGPTGREVFQSPAHTIAFV